MATSASEVSAAEARLAAATRALQLTIQRAYIKVETAERRVALLQTTIVPQSRQAWESSRLAYETDRVDMLTLLDHERTLLDEQLAYFQALGELAAARADLERAVGVDFGRQP